MIKNAIHCIDIWQWELFELQPSFIDLLSHEEQQQASRFHFEKHRRRFIVAHAIMRIILGRYLNKKPQNLVFTTNTYHKPRLVSGGQLEFNLSHSQDLATLAVGMQFPVGVDIEFASERPFLGIAKHMFSEAEVAAVSETECSDLFFHIWTQKEAFIKACGLGLSYPTQDFTVLLTIPSDGMVFDPLHQTYWRICSFTPQVGCYGALCCHPAVQEVRYLRF